MAHVTLSSSALDAGEEAETSEPSWFSTLHKGGWAGQRQSAPRGVS